MKVFILLPVVLAAGVSAQQGAWAQCGGQGFSGGTTCISGYSCVYSNPWYSQCLPGAAPPPTTPTQVAPSVTTSLVYYVTTITSVTFSCPVGSMTTMTSSTPPPPPPTTSTTTTPPPPPSTTSTSATPTPSVGKTQYAGINIAGFDFGCTGDGSCNLAMTDPPLASLGGPDGAAQMQHFVRDDGLNIFRLPVAWQYLVNNNLGGTLSSQNAANYDQLVQACLNTGASCIVDIHNYARWNGGIIGQGGPTNAQFASLWTQLATKYMSQSRVIFGLMNEPHDLNVQEWGATVQYVVTAIRQLGAKNMILLPGTEYTNAQDFVNDGSAAALVSVTNPDGTTTGLVFDVHKYLDSDNSGTSSTCVTNNISGAWQPFAAYLRSVGRQALNTESGGGNTASCETYLCQQIAYLNQNSDVYLGYVTWAAGSFNSQYTLTETPNGNQDTPLVAACIARH